MTINDAHLASHERTRRALAAMPLAIVCFTVPYVAMFATIDWLQPARDEGFADLAYVASLLVVGVVLVMIVIPAVVFTLGRMLDAATRTWGNGRAALAFGGAGLGLGLLLAVILSFALSAALVGTIANLALPAALGGLGTRLILPAALSHRRLYVLSWALAALPVMGAVVLVFSFVLE